MYYPALPAGAFIAAVFVLIPIPAHWRARNVATLSIIVWLFVMDVIYGVNAIVWDDSVEIHMLVWCDITTKITIGASTALPAAVMCVCKHLELVASGRVVRLTSDDKRRRMIFELIMCYGIPACLWPCTTLSKAIDSTSSNSLVVNRRPTILSLRFYAAFALYHFFRQRFIFSMRLQSSNSALSTSRYLRLIAMSITEIIWQTALTALVMYDNISPGLRPWTNWADVHSNFSRVGQFFILEFMPSYQRQFFLFFWVMPISSFIFFIFFGFGEETMKDYRIPVNWIRRRVFRQNITKDSSFGSMSLRPMRAAISSTRSTIIISSDFEDDQILPPYGSPIKARAILIPQEKDAFGGVAKTVEISLDEHDILSTIPSSPSTTISSSSESVHRIVISDPFPASRPPSPHAVMVLSTPCPEYRGPFSIPTVFPTPSDTTHRDGLQVTVYTQTEHHIYFELV
ncbi:Pheromone B beta 1 receptor [Grifola frondosa]|uniref:Pheromone B beta 1 receptor n=1 Tax=Grifola frondosa TaxID=5627 RepID=A0A1C7MHH1_GRIFR|nr:Pheromone B beta 1 receptor [Grifola frondosa]